MRAISFLSLVVLMCGVAGAVEPSDSGIKAQAASLRRMRFRNAPNQTPATTPADKAAGSDKTPATDKSATTPVTPAPDKKADAAPTTESETKTRRRLFFKRRTVAQKSQAPAAAPAVILDSTQTFLLVSDPVPAASDTPATPAPAKATQNVKSKRRFFARRRSGRRMKTASV